MFTRNDARSAAMPESRDYYRGAIAALEGHADSFLPITSAEEDWAYDQARLSADRFKSELATLPTTEPAPALPHGKPLAYEDPSPCPDCAAAWGLVEDCEKALTAQVRAAMSGGVAFVAGDQDLALEAAVCRREAEAMIYPILAKISAARQKRGA